jgi:hypothetical protein
LQKKHPEFVLEQPKWPFSESDLRDNVTHWPGAWLWRLSAGMPGKTVKFDLREQMVIAFNPYKLMEMSFSEGNKAPEQAKYTQIFHTTS